MSDITATLQNSDWVEELQKKVFKECAEQNAPELAIEPSSTVQKLGDVPISVIIHNIHRNFAQVPYFRQRTEFLEELRKSLEKVSRNDHVNWSEFRDSSEHWFLNLINLLRQDGNNNVRLNNSDAPTEDSEKDTLSEEPSEHNDDFNMISMNQTEPVASTYSLTSSSMGVGTMDSSMMDSSTEETDRASDDVAEIDLQVRIRRYNEETANLRDELSRAEDTIATLENDLKMTQTALEKMTNQITRLRKDNDDQREVLVEATQREESCRLDLRKLEKAYAALLKKVEELEVQKENIANLKIKIDKLSKDNSDYAKQLADYKTKYDEKIIECEYLQDEYNVLQEKNSQLQKSYEKNLLEHQEKIQELQEHNADLHSKMNGSDNSNRLSMTPPPYKAYIHSTPYSSNKVFRHQDSLYAELKATDYNIDDKQVQDLKEELSFYNEEIAMIIEQVDKALQSIAASRHELFVPNLQLVETDGVQTLKHKITALLNSVKSCISIKSPLVQTTGEETSEKPDILQTKRTNYPSNNRQFESEKQENDLIGSVTSSLATLTKNGASDKSQSSSDLESTSFLDNSKTADDSEQEIIVPINQALDRIIQIKGTDEDEVGFNLIQQSTAFPSTKTNTDWYDLVDDALKAKKTREHLNLKPRIFGQGDGPHQDEYMKSQILNRSSPQIVTTSDASTLKSDYKAYNPSPEETVKNIDTRYVTIRPVEKTYVLNSIVSSTVDKFESLSLDQSRTESQSENTHCKTPMIGAKMAPRRKLSVYHRSFEVDSLQAPDSVESTTSGKKRSVSTPDVQETDLSSLGLKSIRPLELSITKNKFLNTYRCANNSDSSNSPSPKKGEILFQDSPVFEASKAPLKHNKTVVLAPSKFKLPDSTVKQTLTLEKEFANKKLKDQALLRRTSSIAKISENIEAHQSKILSSSPNIVCREEKSAAKNEIKINFESSYDDSSKTSTEISNTTCGGVLSSDNSAKCTNTSDSVFLPSTERIHTTYTKQDTVEMSKSEEVSSDAIANTTSEDASISCNVNSSGNNGSISDDGCGGGASVELTTSSDHALLAPAPVVRAMSSGEDSSAESECDPLRRRSPEKTSALIGAVATIAEDVAQESIKAIEFEKPIKSILGRRRSNSCSEDQICRSKDKAELKKEKIVIPPAVNGVDKEESFQKVTSNTSPQGITQEDEIPKAFPSWSDEKLQESGIASFPDIDSELSENLSEEEMKKKYVAFSVGLGTDRMTLSKRMILSRRYRDQTEKNFTNELLKLQQDIDELMPLCIDSESIDRVERAKLQLDTVARCAHRISCGAETLGAVHQERRVSRAVLLADRYLQTLRLKCEKLAGELTETKKILAENNIVLEENLSEMGDDVPRVRYRTVSNNNRTMMARRRASIATISRPLLGSNQDISKAPSEAPRQRNSVAGRTPGLRRPSLCYETPKWENEKLDRTDSSTSITELREIFEQAESRRHSREENNNNVIRTSVNNLSTITSEHAEEEEVWSNTREDIVPEIENNDDLNSLELSQQHRHPIIDWLSNRYSSWKPMIWGIVIAFLLGFFLNRVVSSSRRNGPPMLWWSVEEILNQYIEVDYGEDSVPRPI